MNDLFKVLIVAVIGGAIPVFIKIGTSVIPPFTFIVLRLIVSLIFILPFYFINKKKIAGKKMLLIVSLFGALNLICAALGIKRTSPSMSQMLYSTVPIIAAVISYLYLKEKITTKKIIGIIIGFIGVSIIIVSPILMHGGIMQGDVSGNLIVSLGVIFYSAYTVISKKVQEKNSSIAILVHVIFATLFLQLFLLPSELHEFEYIARINPMIIIAILYTGIIGTAIYHFLYLDVINSAGPVVASLALYLQPISTIAWAVFLLGETISISFMVGSVFALFGAYIVSRS